MTCDFLAALFVSISAMFDPKISAGLAIAFIAMLAGYKFIHSSPAVRPGHYWRQAGRLSQLGCHPGLGRQFAPHAIIAFPWAIHARQSQKGKTQVRVAVSGRAVIGKHIADAMVAQDDMELVGVADVVILIALVVAYWPSAELVGS